MRSVVFTGGSPQSPWSAATQQRPQRMTFHPAPHGSPSPLPEPDAGIEGLRKLVFGQHLTDLQTKVAELQLSLNGEVKRMHSALMQRVDELASHLHRDMVVLREETRREIGEIKVDLFAAATSLSVVKDRVGEVEANVRHDTHAAIADLDSRLSRQEFAFASAIENAEAKIRGTIESRCAEAFSQLVRKLDIAQALAEIGARLTTNMDRQDEPVVAVSRELSGLAEDQAAVVLTGTFSRSADDWVCAEVNPFLAATDETV